MYLEDLAIGQRAETVRLVTQQDIEAFAEVSGDRNAVHLDAEYAAKTSFKGRVAHGMLSASFISGVLGTKLPGGGTDLREPEPAFSRACPSRRQREDVRHHQGDSSHDALPR